MMQPCSNADRSFARAVTVLQVASRRSSALADVHADSAVEDLTTHRRRIGSCLCADLHEHDPDTSSSVTGYDSTRPASGGDQNWRVIIAKPPQDDIESRLAGRREACGRGRRFDGRTPSSSRRSNGSVLRTLAATDKIRRRPTARMQRSTLALASWGKQRVK